MINAIAHVIKRAQPNGEENIAVTQAKAAYELIYATVFEDGVLATKQAIKAEIEESWEAWDQANTTERQFYVDYIIVQPPKDPE